MFCNRDFYGRLTVQSSMSSNCHYVESIFVKLGEVVRKYENVLDFPPFYLYYLFMKLFLLQSKTEYLKNNKLNEKKSVKKKFVNI